VIVKEFSEHKQLIQPGEMLRKLKAFSWLSSPQLTGLASEINVADFKRHEVVLDENQLSNGANILLNGVAKISCLNARGERVILALLAPGPIPEFPLELGSPWRFQCEAHSHCMLGSVSWDRFNAITLNAPQSAFREYHQNSLKLWYRLLMRSSSFLRLALHERIGMTLLELCSDFGIEEARGTLLRVAFSHNVLANLVGASRPRVTEHLAQLERDNLVSRQGRQLVVREAQLGDSMSIRGPIPHSGPSRLAQHANG
jgi:CRP/FNR family transcriptional regulator